MKMRLAATLAAAAIPLAGCIDQQIHDRIGYTVASLKDSNIKVAIQRLGYPTAERVVAGDHVYQWILGGPTVTSAFVTGNAAFASGYEVSGQLWCMIEIGTDADGRIIHGTWRGNRGGCAQMANRLPPPPKHTFTYEDMK